ncbi:MAG: lipoyl domain-containing protein [Anaerolineae bacterium]|nr:lipoyl domain-containing protein [Anaerolineae bacterium]
MSSRKLIPIVMPPLGDSADESRIVRWFKAEGEPVRKGEPLFEVETDKTTLQVEAYATGTLAEISVGADQTAQVGQTVGWISQDAPANA